MPSMFRKKSLLLIVSLMLTIPSFWKLVRPGYWPMQDDMQAFRLLEMSKCVGDFQIPCRWIPDGGFGYGYPQYNYYAPGVYYLGQVIHLLGFQFIDVVKIGSLSWGFYLVHLTGFCWRQSFLTLERCGLICAFTILLSGQCRFMSEVP